MDWKTVKEKAGSDSREMLEQQVHGLQDRKAKAGRDSREMLEQQVHGLQDRKAKAGS